MHRTNPSVIRQIFDIREARFTDLLTPRLKDPHGGAFNDSSCPMKQGTSLTARRADLPQLVRSTAQQVQQAGLRPTAIRIAILQAAHAAPEPFSAEDLYRAMNTQHIAVSVGSVYRVLNLFVSVKLLRRRWASNGGAAKLAYFTNHTLHDNVDLIRHSDNPPASMEQSNARINELRERLTDIIDSLNQATRHKGGHRKTTENLETAIRALLAFDDDLQTVLTESSAIPKTQDHEIRQFKT